MPAADVNPGMLEWAISRSRLERTELEKRFPRLDTWVSGERKPTLKQLDEFAKKTHTPIGYLFLDTPPVEELPVPDFRTQGDAFISKPSPNLLDTIYEMEVRQDWMRGYLIEQQEPRLDFVGSLPREADPTEAANTIRTTLGLSETWAQFHENLESALRALSASIESIGILLSFSGIVGMNTRRPLDPQEFRGFVLCDEYAPFIFVNSNDSKSAQMFTLCHELAHVWFGTGGVFNLIKSIPFDSENERNCNLIAAEILIPAAIITAEWQANTDAIQQVRSLARRFKVSPIATARRALDLDLIGRDEFFALYEQIQLEWEQIKNRQRESTGGNFYSTATRRLGKRFSLEIVFAVRQGRLLYRDAYRLTGMKPATFNEFASRILSEA